MKPPSQRSGVTCHSLRSFGTLSRLRERKENKRAVSVFLVSSYRAAPRRSLAGAEGYEETSIMLSMGERHIGVAGSRFGGMADAGERQMRTREQQPVIRHHVEHLLAVGDCQRRIAVKGD